ncbi:MAG: hypothetical protein HY403_02165 [Elusimicrobia bacterium]|nr:hypothetical protein [Elusimicrobiota bacterium]
MEISAPAQSRLLALIAAAVARSAERLGALSGADWKVDIVSIEVGTGARFRAILARDRGEYLGVRFVSPGESYLVLFSEACGKALLRSGPLNLGGFEQPALSEIANIVINAMAAELADHQGMARVLSAPVAERASKAALFDRAFGELRPEGGDDMVDTLIHISSPSLDVDCTFMLRLDALNVNFLMHTDPDAQTARTVV